MRELKSLCVLFVAVFMLYCVAHAEEEELVIKFTGQCPHDVFDFETLFEEHQALVEQLQWDPEGFSTGICEICGEKFLLCPYEADFSNVFNGTNLCLDVFRKLPAVIEEGWYSVGAVGHQYKTYHMAACVMCEDYIKYYTRPSGATATADMIKPHNWTEYDEFSCHDEERDRHLYVTICKDCDATAVADMSCIMYDNGMCTYELKEALEFYGNSW